MSIHRSPVMTRSHASAAAEGDRTDVRNSEQETPGIVKALLEEMRLLRESLTQREEEQAATLRRHEEELRFLQLSLLNNIPQNGNAGSESRVSGAGVDARRENAFGAGADARREDARSEARMSVGVKIKPDTFDRTAPLREFLIQFSLIASVNRWSETEKAVVLASCLRGKARSLLDSCAVSEGFISFEELKSKLELRFGESELT